MEGPCNVIVDTFSRLLRQDDTSALVGKKAIAEDSELASYSFFDDKEIFDCLVNLGKITQIPSVSVFCNPRTVDLTCTFQEQLIVVED